MEIHISYILGEVINWLVDWLDLLWIPVALVILPRFQWLEALSMIICAAIMLRMQVELAQGAGAEYGLTGWLVYPAFYKGMAVYSAAIALYIILMLVLVRYHWRAHILLSFSVFFNAFILSSIVIAI